MYFSKENVYEKTSDIENTKNEISHGKQSIWLASPFLAVLINLRCYIDITGPLKAYFEKLTHLFIWEVISVGSYIG